MNKYINSKNINLKYDSRPKFRIDINNLIYSLVISLNLIFLKFIITSKFLFSEIYIVKFFNKSINIATIFYPNYIIYKIIYYIFSYMIIVYITYYIRMYILKKLIKQNQNSIVQNVDSFVLGSDISNKEEIKNIDLNKTKNLNNKLDNKLNNNYIYIKKHGMYQNILVTGSIGSR